MPKQGEIDYINHIGSSAAQQALDKPFSYELCGRYLMEIGTIMNLLPPWPPARILDLGVGTGWTSIFYAKRGYSVVGQDIAPDMIALANKNKERYRVENVTFMVSDYETLMFNEEFDCAIFYDALHHAVDEEAAIAKVYQALRPNGICITVEPGEGHSQSNESQEAMSLYGVTEKDMPPHHIIDIGKSIGFRQFRVYARHNTAELLLDSEVPTPPPGRLDLVVQGIKEISQKIFNPILKPIEPPYPPIALRASNIVVMVK